MVLQLTNPFNKLSLPELKRPVASIPLKEVEGVEANVGILESGQVFVCNACLRAWRRNLVLLLVLAPAAAAATVGVIYLFAR